MKKNSKDKVQLRSLFSQSKEEPKMFELENRLYLGTTEPATDWHFSNRVGK